VIFNDRRTGSDPAASRSRRPCMHARMSNVLAHTSSLNTVRPCTWPGAMQDSRQHLGYCSERTLHIYVLNWMRRLGRSGSIAYCCREVPLYNKNRPFCFRFDVNILQWQAGDIQLVDNNFNDKITIHLLGLRDNSVQDWHE
jgi:hypothetical protein